MTMMSKSEKEGDFKELLMKKVLRNYHPDVLETKTDFILHQGDTDSGPITRCYYETIFPYKAIELKEIYG